MTTEEILFIIVIVLFVVYLLLSAFTMNWFERETKKKIDTYEKQELKNPFSNIVSDRYISGIDPYDEDGEGMAPFTKETFTPKK